MYYREMIEEVRPDCIHICTPNNTHKEIAVYALEHGINVVCEKPMARNTKEAEEHELSRHILHTRVLSSESPSCKKSPALP